MQTTPVKTTFPEGHRLAGKPAWFFEASRRYVPVVSGGEGPTDPPTPAPAAVPPVPAPPAPAPGATTPPEPGVPQERVNALLASEKEKAEKRVMDEVAKTLGVTVEEAKAIVERQKTADAAHLTDAEKAKLAADKDKADAATDRAAAAADRHDALIERRLVAAGVDDKVLTRAVGMVRAEVAVGADAAAVDTAVTALKTDVPALFGTPLAPGAPRPPSSSPSGTPPKPRPEGDPYTAAFERGRTAARPKRQGVEAANAK